jgi:hypothetical protein
MSAAKSGKQSIKIINTPIENSQSVLTVNSNLNQEIKRNYQI